MSIRSELESLRDANGHLHPATIVEWARQHPKSELYQKFEWDDEKAGHLYRMEQARGLIQVYIRNVSGFRETFSLVSDRNTGGGYRDSDDITNIPAMQAEAVEMAYKDAQRFARLYWLLRGVDADLDRVFRAIDRLGRGGTGPSPPGTSPSPVPASGGRGRRRGGGGAAVPPRS
jgi:hypothetical protein